MKKLLVIATMISFVTFTACEQEGEEIDGLTDSESVVALDLQSETAVESSFEDVDVIAEAGLEVLDMEMNAAGRIAHGDRPGGDRHQDRHPRRERPDHILDCATVDRDTVNQIVTIDFGDGCEGPHGTIRKGKIIIQWSGDRHEYGSYRTVTLEDFYVDSLKLEGTRRMENLTESDSTDRIMRITMTDGKVTFPDSTFATREADHTRTFVQGEEEGDDYSTVTGGASGLRRDGSEYTITILEDLVFKRGCWAARTVIPVEGVKEIVSGDDVATINYGDGTCDNEIEITINGETTIKTIEPKGRERHHQGK